MSHYYLCRKCGTIREDVTRADGTLTGETCYHRLDGVDLPAAVVEQARALLDAPTYRQPGLFSDDGR